MSDAIDQGSLRTDRTAEEVNRGRSSGGDRAFAVAYFAITGAAMAGWLYVIARAALALIGWVS